MTAKIKLNAASGGGSISIQAPSSSSNNRVISLPDIADGTLLTSQSSLDSTKLSPAITGGKLLQVVQTMKTDTFSSTTSSSWTDITGVTVNITPSASTSKILVSFHGACSSNDDSYLWLRMARVIGGTTVVDLCRGASRNNSVLCTLDGNQGVQTNKNSSANHSSFEFLDSPNTTSQITYKMQFYKAMGTYFFIGGTYADFDLNKGSVPTFMTVKEIAA